MTSAQSEQTGLGGTNVNLWTEWHYRDLIKNKELWYFYFVEGAVVWMYPPKFISKFLGETSSLMQQY